MSRIKGLFIMIFGFFFGIIEVVWYFLEKMGIEEKEWIWEERRRVVGGIWSFLFL